ncbi:hypothetical protein C8J57DRAFT_1234791 [Mycena rebaudengoi]|nr:hypothetical protein C8J57DRAFT_1234791 [Mycena rebaudengoi]
MLDPYSISPTPSIDCQSIAGTVVARVLADHFDRVILVDPELLDLEKPKTQVSPALFSLFTDGARRVWPNFVTELRAMGGRHSGSATQKALHAVLMQHLTAANITVWPGTVRGVEASDNQSSIRSVIVRKLDGTQVVVNDIGLVVGGYFFDSQTESTSLYVPEGSKAGMKWLETAAFSLPDNLRCSYKPNIRTAFHGRVHRVHKLCRPVPTRQLPGSTDSAEPGRHSSSLGSLSPSSQSHTQHFTYGLSVTALRKTDNNTMQVMLTSSEDNLPRSVPEILPFPSPSFPEAFRHVTSRRMLLVLKACGTLYGCTHEEAASVLWRVRNMFAADRALLAPTVLWKALWTRSLF